jgi:hypothetical protein
LHGRDWVFDPNRYAGCPEPVTSALLAFTQIFADAYISTGEPPMELAGMLASIVRTRFQALTTEHQTLLLRALLADAPRWHPILRTLAPIGQPGRLELVDVERAIAASRSGKGPRIRAREGAVYTPVAVVLPSLVYPWVSPFLRRVALEMWAERVVSLKLTEIRDVPTSFLVDVVRRATFGRKEPTRNEAALFGAIFQGLPGDEKQRVVDKLMLSARTSDFARVLARWMESE